MKTPSLPFSSSCFTTILSSMTTSLEILLLEMKKLIKKNWEYVLYQEDTMLILSVVCGTVALYDVNIELNETEEKQYCNLGEPFIDELAEQIRYSPSKFMSRNIKLPKL